MKLWERLRGFEAQLHSERAQKNSLHRKARDQRSELSHQLETERAKVMALSGALGVASDIAPAIAELQAEAQDCLWASGPAGGVSRRHRHFKSQISAVFNASGAAAASEHHSHHPPQQSRSSVVHASASNQQQQQQQTAIRTKPRGSGGLLSPSKLVGVLPPQSLAPPPTVPSPTHSLSLSTTFPVGSVSILSQSMDAKK